MSLWTWKNARAAAEAARGLPGGQYVRPGRRGRGAAGIGALVSGGVLRPGGGVLPCIGRIGLTVDYV